MDERIGLVEGLATDQTFLGQPIGVAQRWADSGMPVTREGSPRLCLTRRTEPLAGTRICRAPVQMATEDIDRSSELKRGLPSGRKQSRRGLRKRGTPNV